MATFLVACFTQSCLLPTERHLLAMVASPLKHLLMTKLFWPKIYGGPKPNGTQRADIHGTSASEGLLKGEQMWTRCCLAISRKVVSPLAFLQHRLKLHGAAHPEIMHSPHKRQLPSYLMAGRTLCSPAAVSKRPLVSVEESTRHKVHVSLTQDGGNSGQGHFAAIACLTLCVQARLRVRVRMCV